MCDRPLWPPGAEIAAQCFDHFTAWETRWCEELEEVDDIMERAIIYGFMVEGSPATGLAARSLQPRP
jgi:hypothetical protein